MREQARDDGLIGTIDFRQLIHEPDDARIELLEHTRTQQARVFTTRECQDYQSCGNSQNRAWKMAHAVLLSPFSVFCIWCETRREILLLLKQRVRATIVELAQQLGMTHEGVRAHVLHLQQDGWVTADCTTTDLATDEQPSGRPPSCRSRSSTPPSARPR